MQSQKCCGMVKSLHSASLCSSPWDNGPRLDQPPHTQSAKHCGCLQLLCSGMGPDTFPPHPAPPFWSPEHRQMLWPKKKKKKLHQKAVFATTQRDPSRHLDTSMYVPLEAKIWSGKVQVFVLANSNTSQCFIHWAPASLAPQEGLPWQIFSCSRQSGSMHFNIL